MPADHAASTAHGAETRGPGAPRARSDHAVELVRAAVVTVVVAVVAEVGAAVVVAVHQWPDEVVGAVGRAASVVLLLPRGWGRRCLRWRRWWRWWRWWNLSQLRPQAFEFQPPPTHPNRRNADEADETGCGEQPKECLHSVHLLLCGLVMNIATSQRRRCDDHEAGQEDRDGDQDVANESVLTHVVREQPLRLGARDLRLEVLNALPFLRDSLQVQTLCSGIHRVPPCLQLRQGISELRRQGLLLFTFFGAEGPLLLEFLKTSQTSNHWQLIDSLQSLLVALKTGKLSCVL